MKVEYRIPNNLIKDVVQKILVIEDCLVTTPFLLPLYANGSPTLLFQTVKGYIDTNSNHLTLFGQTVSPKTLTLKDNFTLIAYFFKPFSLSTLFSISARELTNNPINLDLIEPSRATELTEQLLNAQSTDEMLLIFDRYIFDLLRTVKTNNEIMKFATDKIARNPHNTILQEVRNNLPLTERTFQRKFKEQIGVSPSLFRRVCQFSAAFAQLQQRDYRSLTDIAFNNNYTDQSHYINTFKEFTNITPKEYLYLGNPLKN